MALPTILINSATGSDTAASGAGPGTALTGSSASTDGAGTTVTLDGSPSLTGVATDGSHVIYLADSTAGARNFGKITAKDDGAKTVTVANAFGLSLSGKSWAIGGKRASLLGTNSRKLIENNSSNGDAMPGWIMEMESGHTETSSTSVMPRRAGDTTTGEIVIRGTAGAITKPILTFSNNSYSFLPNANNWAFLDFEMRNTNATKTASVAIQISNTVAYLRMSGLVVNHATDKYWKAYYNAAIGSSAHTFQNCSFGNCASYGIDLTAGATGVKLINNLIFSCGSHGIALGTGPFHVLCRGNVIAYNSGDGINSAYSSTTVCYHHFCGNVFHGNTGDGLEITNGSSTTGVLGMLLVENNEFTYNGGYGLNLAGSPSDAVLTAWNTQIRNNGFYSNTSGKYNPSGLGISTDELTTDPSSGSATSTKDYAGTTGGTNFMSSVHKAKGYPIGGTLAIGTGSSSYNYIDIGLQHQDTGGGGGLACNPIGGFIG